MKMQIARKSPRIPNHHPKPTVTFEAVANQFISEQHARGNADATIRHYEQTIRKLELFLAYLTKGEEGYTALTKEEAHDIGKSELFSVLDSNRADAAFRLFLYDVERLSEQSVTTYFRDYRVIMYYAMDNDYAWPRGITVKNVESGVKEVYTSDELEKLLKKPEAQCSFTEYRNWVVVNYLLATGNRVGTIINLRIADLDFDDCMIAINTQKNKKKARIPMEKKHLAKILRDYIDEWLVDGEGNYVGEYLFPSSFIESDSPMSRVSMGRAIACYNKSRGVKKTSIHLFRHTFVKNWIISGGDLHSLQKILGHSTLDMVVHYANLYEKDLSDKVDNFSTLSLQNADRFSHVHRKRPHIASERS